MADSELKPKGLSSESPVQEVWSKEIGTAEGGGLSDPNHVELQRALKARHITMIGECSSMKLHSRSCTKYLLAIGGAIGTGLIIGTGEALAK